ncbi:unnamed protein product [Mortierella alpina]
MTRVSRSNSAVYDDQDENFPPRNHAHLAPQRPDKHALDTGAYPEDENDDYLDKENQPAGMVIYEDSQPARRHSRPQPLHQQQPPPPGNRISQPHHSQQFSQDHRHPGDNPSMTGNDRADSGIFEDSRRVGGALDAQDMESASDQENVQPCPSTPPAAATTAAPAPADVVLDARDELLMREKYLADKYLAQRQNARTELMERSRNQRQAAAAQQEKQLLQQQEQQQEQQQRNAQKLPLPTLRDAPGAPVRKRTRKSMEDEEHYQQQLQQHPETQRNVSQAQDPERLAQEQARRHRARQAQAQNGGRPSQQAQARDDGQRKRPKGQQQDQHEQQEQQRREQEAAAHRERVFLEKYEKLTQAIEYGDVYYDSKYEYRNVTLPKIMLSFIDRKFMEFPENPYCNVLRILTEDEWREVGITMSQYWVNWMRHEPEPHVLLFRRPVGTGARMKKESERLKKESERAAREAAREKKLRLEQEAKNGTGLPEQQQQQQQQQEQQQQQQQSQPHHQQHHQQQQH